MQLSRSTTFRGKYNSVAKDLAIDLRSLDLSSDPKKTCSLLDIGARDQILGKILQRELPGRINYQSADIAPGCDHLVNLEQPLPFPDSAFDYVVALDVLEHVDNFHAAFKELYRITTHKLIIGLPNMAFLSNRVSFALYGALATDKYDLRSEPTSDRHRWLPSYSYINATVQTLSKTIGARKLFALDEIGSSTFSRVMLYPLSIINLAPRSLITGRVIHFIER